MEKIEVVAATRFTSKEFWATSALGLSLQRLKFDSRISYHIFYENKRGLSTLYNERIHINNDVDIIVFVHDDVWIEDYFFADRVTQGVRQSHIIGVAGNKRRVPYQPSWTFLNTNLQCDSSENLSGSVAHGDQPFGPVSFFGPIPMACELMDGVFLASRKSLLKSEEVLFDPQFEFHFYDIDFCRTARSQGLRLSTWPICLTHQSKGAFKSDSWLENYQRYLAKWKS